MKTFFWSSEIEVLIASKNIQQIENVFLQNEKKEWENPEFWLYKGEIFQKLQNWGIALNAYLKVLELQPDNKTASSNIEIIQNILNFWNPEMFNA